MNNVIYKNEGEKPKFDVEALRKLLPSNFVEAKGIILDTLHELETDQVVCPEVKKINVGTGTSVRGISFKNHVKAVLHFAEGSSVEIDQSGGVYDIGEKLYSFNKSVYGTANLNMDAHYRAEHVLNTYQEIGSAPNQVLLDLVYKEFPKVRVNDEDTLYNIFDVNQVCKRIEVFRAFVTYGIAEFIKLISDDAPKFIVAIEFGYDSLNILRDIVNDINAMRRHKISIAVELDEVDSSIYRYYLSDVWIHPSSFDHNCIAAPGRDIDITSKLVKALGRSVDYVTENSSFVVGSYAPILDIFYFDNRLLSSLSEYGYSQYTYVPHKPWTIINITQKHDRYKINFKDNSSRLTTQRFLVRVEMWSKLIYSNLFRNLKLANSTDAIEIYRTLKTFYSDTRKRELGSYFEWALTTVMRSPITFRVKRLAYDGQVTPYESIKMLMRVSMLDDGVYYTANDMVEFEWSYEMIARAVELGYLSLWRDGTIPKYAKYERTNPSWTHMVTRPAKLDSVQLTVIDESGFVMSVDRDVKDTKLTYSPLNREIYIEGKNYSVPVSYDPVIYSTIPKPVTSTKSFVFAKDTPIEFQVNESKAEKSKAFKFMSPEHYGPNADDDDDSFESESLEQFANITNWSQDWSYLTVPNIVPPTKIEYPPWSSIKLPKWGSKVVDNTIGKTLYPDLPKISVVKNDVYDVINSLRGSKEALET